MNPQSNFSALDASLQQVVEEACEQFEQCWKAGDKPDLEAFIESQSDPIRSVLLCELLTIELHYRSKQAGAPVSDESIVRAHPRLSGEIAAALRKLRQLETTRNVGDTGSQPPAVASQPHYDEQVPECIGKYRVIGLLDAGGQAKVYRAVHPHLAKELAIKVSQKPAPVEARDRDNLVEEGRVLADLEHPYLARVYDVDFHQGHAYLVVEFIRGRNLVQHFKFEKPAPREAAGLVAKVARAVAFVHQRGVVHRDIKPNNVIIDERGEPRLIDFGLAQLSDAWTNPSGRSEDWGGTPAFMAPEQARLDGLVDAKSDIFALGAVLYWLLTGKSPFAGTEARDSLRRAEACQFDREALQVAGIPHPLASVCLRAMAKDPADRFDSAEQFAAALEEWGTTNQGKATPVQRALLFVAAAACAAVIATAVFLLSNTANAPRTANHDSTSGDSQAEPTGGSQEGTPADSPPSETGQSGHVLEPVPSTPVPEEADSTTTERETTLPWTLVHELRGHELGVNSVAFHDDGKRLVSASSDGTMKLWNVETGECRRTFGRELKPYYGYYSVDIAPEGTFVASAHGDQVIGMWDIESGELLDRLGEDGWKYRRLAFSPADSLLAVGDATIQLWDVRQEQIRLTLEGHGASLNDLAFNRDGSLLATVDAYKELRIWDVKSGECRRVVDVGREFNSVAFSPDGKQVAACGGTTVMVWDVATAKLVHELMGSRSSYGPNAIAYSPDGAYLAFDSDGGTVKIWDTRTERIAETLDSVIPHVKQLEFSPEGRFLAVGGQGATISGIIQIWTLGKKSKTDDRPY